MKIKKILSSLVLLAVTAPGLFGQAVADKKPTEDKAALKKEAVAFLQETMVDVNNLRTLENRISFSAELAGLMWFHDEKEARSLYLMVFGNFKELLIQYDQQMNAFGEPKEDEDEPTYNGGMFGDVTDKARLMRRFQTAMQVRQQIAMSLAEHDAELAFSFYFESLSALTNAEFRSQMESRDKHFETQLMTQIAATNTAKATQYAVKSISDGISYYHIELLKKIHEKDPEKGAEFASAMVSKIKSDSDSASDFWVTSTFLNTAGESFDKSKAEGGKKPMLDQQGLRDLADAFASAILASDRDYPNGAQYADQIGKYNPARAVQIRAKFKNAAASGDRTYATNAMASAANSMANADTAANSSNANSRAERERLNREKSEKELQENVEKLRKKELPREEREKIVAQARHILTHTPGRDKKIVGLSALASQVAKAGDKELAAEIMKEAHALINPQPKNYQDFLLTWMLATGYAEADPEKAFPLLEDTIVRANETLAAFIKVGEFIDVAGEMIDDGEVQVGAFGGQMIRGLRSELGMADNTLRILARADFKKTRGLSNRFDRTEVRILAKMMILRAVLGESEKPKAQMSEAPIILK